MLVEEHFIGGKYIMRIVKPLFVVVMLVSMLGLAYCEDAVVEKAAFDLPDLVIQSQDKSQSDLIDKVKAGQQEISYDKEVPTVKKIDPELVFSDKQSFGLASKTEQGLINQFKFGLGNLNLLHYRFIHGQTFADNSYLLGLSRYLLNDYIPQGGRSQDELSLDASTKLSASERISISSRMERKDAFLPGNTSSSTGNHQLTYVPINISYSNKLSSTEYFTADFELETLDLYANGEQRNWFGLGTELSYKLALPDNLTLITLAKLNNSVSLFDASLRYQTEEKDRLQGAVGLKYYQSFLPRVTNESMFAIELEGKLDLSSNTLLQLIYSPEMPAIEMSRKLIDQPYSELNYQLSPQVDVSNWQALWAQSWLPKLSSQMRFGYRRSSQVIGMFDSNGNGFIEPVNIGWGSLWGTELRVDYEIDEQFSCSVLTKLLNYRTESGQIIPGYRDNSLSFRLAYTDTKESLVTAMAIRYLGNQADALNTNQTLAGVMLVDLEASKVLNDRIKLTAKIDNLLNEVYFNRSDFREPGMSIEFGGEVVL